jgi:hypothetical protein
MATWTVVGLLDETTGDLHVAGVFEGTCQNMDRNVDAEVGGQVMEQFVGYFDADDADDAAELAREIMKNPVGTGVYSSGRRITRPARDVPVRGDLL